MFKKDIKSISYGELSEWVSGNNYKKFRTNQIFSWLHEKNIVSFNQMKNVSQQIIQQMDSEFYINSIKIKKNLYHLGRIR